MTPSAEIAEQPAALRVSVVIVSLNRVESLRRSLTALGDRHQVIVVDNGSTDGSAQLDTEFPHARFSKLPKNFGLTKALNIGIRAAEGELILLLHDDTVISGENVSKLGDYLEAHPGVGAVCPALDSPQVGSLLLPSSPAVEWRAAEFNEAEAAVECASGAAILFRASFLRALRQIDERYGTFGSAIELSRQVRRANRTIVILRDVPAHHENAESPVRGTLLAGDRIAGTAAYLGKHHGFMSGLTYRISSALSSLFSFRFKSLAGAVSGVKIDGTS